jgi:LmbE family N-acetylglucosaminyl deacetylase
MKENILVICAHSDDQVFGVGGTIAKYVREGKEVHTLIFSYGENSHPWLQQDVTVKMRSQESYDADAILGGSGVTFFDIKEGNFLKDMAVAKKKLAVLIGKHKPTKIFTHSEDDPHPDHKAVAGIVLGVYDALKPKAQVYTFDVWSPVKVKERFAPKLIVPIRDTFSLKLQALRCFKSQWVAMIVLLWSVYARALKNGLLYGGLLAEKFYKVR